MLYSNCHTHTVFCDGSNTPEEMVRAALDKGFACLGFSVHSPMRSGADWTIQPENLPAYLAEIRRLQRVYAGKIDILNGIELDADYSAVAPADFDYVIGSVHQLTVNGHIYEVDNTRDILEDCAAREFGGDFLRLAAQYYADVAAFICRVRPQIVGHLDLIEKFNEDQTLFSTNDPVYQALALQAVEKITNACPDTLFEVNTGAMFRLQKKAPYPAPFLLRALKKSGARVIVTSDAHCTDALDFAFDIALAACRAAGFDEVYALRRDGFVPVKI